VNGDGGSGLQILLAYMSTTCTVYLVVLVFKPRPELVKHAQGVYERWKGGV
jgi:hypothetical protein